MLLSCTIILSKALSTHKTTNLLAIFRFLNSCSSLSWHRNFHQIKNLPINKGIQGNNYCLEKLLATPNDLQRNLIILCDLLLYFDPFKLLRLTKWCYQSQIDLAIIVLILKNHAKRNSSRLEVVILVGINLKTCDMTKKSSWFETIFPAKIQSVLSYTILLS